MSDLPAVLTEAEALLIKREGECTTSYAGNDIVPVLQILSYQAKVAFSAGGEDAEKFLDLGNRLRDLCVAVGHPNTLKERSCYRTIKASFPAFTIPENI